MTITTPKNPHASALARIAVGPRIYDRHLVAAIFSRLFSAGYSRRQIAQEMGVSVGTVSHWETGKRNPPIDLEFCFESI